MKWFKKKQVEVNADSGVIIYHTDDGPPIQEPKIRPMIRKIGELLVEQGKMRTTIIPPDYIFTVKESNVTLKIYGIHKHCVGFFIDEYYYNIDHSDEQLYLAQCCGKIREKYAYEQQKRIEDNINILLGEPSDEKSLNENNPTFDSQSEIKERKENGQSGAL